MLNYQIDKEIATASLSDDEIMASYKKAASAKNLAAINYDGDPTIENRQKESKANYLFKLFEQEALERGFLREDC